MEDVVFPAQKRNVVLILMESAENTLNDSNLFEEHLMPHLEEMQKKYISFNNHYQVTGTGWSIAGITAYMFGIPLRLPQEMYHNNMSKHQNFLPGAVSLLDILEANDYRIIMTKGSLIKHAGTDKLFLNHAPQTEIFDLDYYLSHDPQNAVNHPHRWRWGLPDQYIYERTKAYLVSLDKSTPFFLMFVTVDTHTWEADYDYKHVSNLKNKYGDQRDAFMAADTMVYDFLTWLQERDFYENTTVIIIGDHLLMSSNLGPVELSPPDNYQRYISNIFINSVIDPEKTNTNSRIFASFDMAPTILEAMGAKLPLRRFGLGTSLFSDELTLLEKYGVKTYETEISKRSKLYNTFY